MSSPHSYSTPIHTMPTLHRLATLHNAEDRQTTDRSIGIGRLCYNIGALTKQRCNLEYLQLKFFVNVGFFGRGFPGQVATFLGSLSMLSFQGFRRLHFWLFIAFVFLKAVWFAVRAINSSRCRWIMGARVCTHACASNETNATNVLKLIASRLEIK